MRYQLNPGDHSNQLPFAGLIYGYGIPKDRFGPYFLVGLTCLALYLCYVLIAPFLRPILVAFVMAVLFFPVHRTISRRLRNRNLAALLSTFLALSTVILTGFLLVQALASGLRDVFDSLRNAGNGSERLGLYLIELLDRVVAFAGRYLPIATYDLRDAALSQAERGLTLLLSMTAGALGSMTKLAINTLIAFFLLFFLLRDGRRALRRLVVLLPLQVGQSHRLLARVKGTLYAVVYGSMSIAALQGILAGAGFWLLGVASPGLWAVVTGLCALLPVVGTGFVLLPAISMLIFTGHWIKGFILIAWGLLIVHPIDNVLRPVLIGNRTELSTLYVFFALIGGLRAFGPVGVFIGPTILAVTLALMRFLREEKRSSQLARLRNRTLLPNALEE